jgi:hypothetical protein
MGPSGKAAPPTSVCDSLHVPVQVGAPYRSVHRCSSHYGPQIGVGPVSKVVSVHIIKENGGVEVYLHSYLTSILDGGQFQVLAA